MGRRVKEREPKPMRRVECGRNMAAHECRSKPEDASENGRRLLHCWGHRCRRAARRRLHPPRRADTLQFLAGECSTVQEGGVVTTRPSTAVRVPNGERSPSMHEGRYACGGEWCIRVHGGGVALRHVVELPPDARSPFSLSIAALQP